MLDTASPAGVDWAQTGFVRIRQAGQLNVGEFVYAEMFDSSLPPAQRHTLIMNGSDPVPADGSSHSYALKFEKAKGLWTYIFDGDPWHHQVNVAMKNNDPTNVQWSGEVLNTTDRMPGTDNNRCVLSNCQYKVPTQKYKLANFVAADFNNANPTKYGLNLASATAFSIWDKFA